MNTATPQQQAQQLLARLKAIAQLNRQSRLKREQLNRTVKSASN